MRPPRAASSGSDAALNLARRWVVGTACAVLVWSAVSGARAQQSPVLDAPALRDARAEPDDAPFREPPALRTTRDPDVFVPVRAAVRAPVTRLAPIPDAPRAVRRVAPEDAPFDPIGLRVGVLTLRPSIEQSLGWDSNPERVETGARGRALSRTQGSVTLETDWSRHALTGSANGSVDAYRGGDIDPRASGDAALALRLDIRDDVALTLGGTAATATQRIGSPELPGDLAQAPQTSTFGGSAALALGFNRVGVTMRGAIERTVNGDAARLDGTRLDRSADDYTQQTAALRLDYEASPGFRPFVEGAVDRRIYDEAGATRDSAGVSGRVGTAVEITRLLTGEASVGVARRDYEDPSRAAVRGVVGAASLVWTPTALTTLTLTGESALDETNVPGADGARARRVSLAVSHEARRDLVFDASLTLARTDYTGTPLTEDLIAATAGLEWRVTRTLAVTAEVSHERLRSSAPGGDYTANVALFGVRLAR